MSVMPTDQTAPVPLELVRAFVNTLDVEDSLDALEDRDQAQKWLIAHGLDGGEDSVDEEDRQRLIAVREALRRLLDANNAGDSPPADALSVLNEQSAAAAVALRFDAEGAALVTSCGGVDSAIARLLSIVHDSMNDGTWRRLKACPAEDCRWAFYDHSRNRSGSWCAMAICGNRTKTRSYRRRREA